MKKSIPASAAIILLTSVIFGAAVFGAGRIKAADRTYCQEPQKVDRQYCLSCHTDAKTLKAMRDKRGE